MNSDPCAERVDAATAAVECHWRAVTLDRDATIAGLWVRVIAAENLVAVLTRRVEELGEENKRLSGIK
jgi:hypothetical protein